jgi:hypothetical protein
MGFQPGLTRVSLGISADYNFLASEHLLAVRGGVTIDQATVGGVDSNGNRILQAGTLLGEITATGKYGPYDDGASDGRETAKGFLVEAVNFKDNVDIISAIMLHGSVIESRTSGVDANAKTDLAGAIIFQ